jgi:hypothetical protein
MLRKLPILHNKNEGEAFHEEAQKQRSIGNVAEHPPPLPFLSEPIKNPEPTFSLSIPIFALSARKKREPSMNCSRGCFDASSTSLPHLFSHTMQ